VINSSSPFLVPVLFAILSSGEIVFPRVMSTSGCFFVPLQSSFRAIPTAWREIAGRLGLFTNRQTGVGLLAPVAVFDLAFLRITPNPRALEQLSFIFSSVNSFILSTLKMPRDPHPPLRLPLNRGISIARPTSMLFAFETRIDP